MNKMLNSYWFEADPEQIRIKDNQGNLVSSLDIKPGDHVIARQKYVLNDNDWKLLTGDFRRNKLIVKHRGGTGNYYFAPDSNYAIGQLESILQLWQDKGCKVDRIKL